MVVVGSAQRGAQSGVAARSVLRRAGREAREAGCSERRNLSSRRLRSESPLRLSACCSRCPDARLFAFRRPSKTYLKCAIARIKQTQARKNNESKVMAKEIGALLTAGREELARIKVEHLIRNKDTQHALEIIELFCDLLLARHMLIESERTLPVEMQESVFSVCWAASRADVAELAGVKDQFAYKYEVVRAQFFPRQGETPPEQITYVNPKLLQYLGVTTPPPEKVLAYLQEIGGAFAPDWQPSAGFIDPGASGAVPVPEPAPAPSMPARYDPRPGPPPMAAPGPAGAVTVTFTEQALGLDLIGVDHSGREAASPDSPTMCVVVRGVRL